ncbi:MAG: hypothetical protein ABGY96_26830 [bacterium]
MAALQGYEKVDIWLLDEAGGDAIPWQRTHATEKSVCPIFFGLIPTCVRV